MSVANRIPISVRISQEDADFIANLQVEGANTPSEKIRELLKHAKLDVLHAEKELGVHSHILARLFELLPDLTATLVADVPTKSELEALKKYEREVMWRIVRLTDSILQLAVTGKGAAFDDSVLAQLENTLNLAHIIRQRDEK